MARTDEGPLLIDRFLKIRYFILIVALLLLVAELSKGEEIGSDVFVTTRTILWASSRRNARRVANLQPGTRLRLVSSGERYLKVALERSATGQAEGYLEIGSALAFAPGAAATGEMLVVGRSLCTSRGLRCLGVAILIRAIDRCRTEGVEDPEDEVALGEAAEALLAEGSPRPESLEVRAIQDLASGKTLFFYAGPAFEHAFQATIQGGETVQAVQERAIAGLVRSQFPQTQTTLMPLWQESALWLEFIGRARSPQAWAPAADRLGEAALPLARLLLAAARPSDLQTLLRRVRDATVRIRAVAPQSAAGARLVSKVNLLEAMAGDGGPSFPQSAKRGSGGSSVRIEGSLGELALVVSGSGAPSRRLAAVPILPVPGSLRVSPDGTTAAWLEVARPGAIVCVAAALAGSSPAREVTLLASGRPRRDRRLPYVMTRLDGFTPDGRGIALRIRAWEETAPMSERLAIVSPRTGRLLFDSSSSRRHRAQYRRLADIREEPAYHSGAGSGQ
jgi:hypothetical protein